jgi:lipopolysaccharide/colanic/teichoic acid biosynthesis glycosyltransferase
MLEGGKVLASVAALPEIWRALKPDRVVADLATVEKQLPPELIARTLAAGVVVERPAALYERLFTRIPVSSFQPSALFFGGEEKPAPVRVALQSVYNNLAALVILLLFSPVMLLIAVLIKASSPGPAWEGQSTMGWELLPFTLYRFRSTRIRPRTEGDIREVTLMGRWLKRLHLDGLPQFVSVLRGEMSLVGPRPAATESAKGLIESLPGYHMRFAVKPGLLSLGGIKAGASSSDAAAELEYDLYYAKHVSMALDFHILLHSFRLQLRRWFGTKAVKA